MARSQVAFPEGDRRLQERFRVGIRPDPHQGQANGVAQFRLDRRLILELPLNRLGRQK